MSVTPLPRSWARALTVSSGKSGAAAHRSEALVYPAHREPFVDIWRGAPTSPVFYSAAVNNQTNEGVAIKKVTNVFSKKILAKRALREIKLLQHFRGHRNVSARATPLLPVARTMGGPARSDRPRARRVGGDYDYTTRGLA